MKVFCAAFMCLQLGFVISCKKKFGAKAAHKLLIKLTPVSISPTFYEQLLCRNHFAKKLQTQIVST
jgi:hypothetical protein